jgi:hypothetical protein
MASSLVAKQTLFSSFILATLLQVGMWNILEFLLPM